MIRGGEEGCEIGIGAGGDGFVAAGFSADSDEVHAEGCEEFGEASADGAEADDEGGLAVEEEGFGADWFGGPAFGTALVDPCDGKSAGGGQHECEGVLSAGFGVGGRAVGHGGAARFERMADVVVVVSGVAGGGEVDPFEALDGDDLVGVGLAEGDVGLFEEGVGWGYAEVVGLLFAEEEAGVGDALAQAIGGGGGEGGVAPDG